MSGLFKNTRFLAVVVVVSGLFSYLEWGAAQHAFLFEVEYDLLFGTNRTPDNFSHPLVMLPIAGQILLLVTAFLKESNRWLLVTGILLQALLLGMVLLAGVLSLNLRICGSVLPFFVTSFLLLRISMFNKTNSVSA